MSTEVLGFPHGETDLRGTTIYLAVLTKDGQQELAFKYEHLNSLVALLIQLGNAAYRSQVETGFIPAMQVPTQPAQLEGFRVLAHSSGQHALLEIVSRKTPTHPLDILTASADRDLISGLAEKLRSVLDQLKQTSNPS